MARLGLYTKFTARPGERERLVAQLLRAAAGVEHLDGCRLYVVNSSLTEPDAVWVTEIWDSEEEHRASLSMPGTPELIQETLPLLAGPPQQVRLTPLGGKGLSA